MDYAKVLIAILKLLPENDDDELTRIQTQLRLVPSATGSIRN